MTRESPVARLRAGKHFTFKKASDFAIKTSKGSRDYGYIDKDDYDPEIRNP